MRETLLWIPEGLTRASPTLLHAAGRLDAAARAWVTTRLAGRVPLGRRSVGLALAVVTGLWLWGAAGSGELRSVAGLQEAMDSPAREWERHDVYLGWSQAEEWQPRLAQGKDVLISHTIEGFNDMPSLGYCMSCEREDFEAMIDFMSGGGQ